jgi:hypothetical protein
MKTENFYPKIYDEVFKLLKSSKLVTEFDIYNSDECVGIEEGQFYITITHHVDLMKDSGFSELCDGAEIASSDLVDKETSEYETQLVF